MAFLRLMNPALALAYEITPHATEVFNSASGIMQETKHSFLSLTGFAGDFHM
jgi:hypothetical protein